MTATLTLVPAPPPLPNWAETPALAALWDLLDVIENEFVELTACLQEERQRMVTFEVRELLEVSQRKEELLLSIAAEARERRPVFEAAWSDADLTDQPIPDRVPEALRHLASCLPGQAPEMAERADRLDVLMDVIEELQDLNRTVVRRALGWVDNYLREISGTQATGSYDAAGRFRERSASALRRTV